MASLLERVRDAVAPHYLVERELGAGGMGVTHEWPQREARA